MAIAPKIRNVLLAAPDVDVDLAREAIVDMGPKSNRPSFTLFVSQDDRALAMSRRVWGSEARLGAINPDQEPYRTQLEQASVTVLDLTKLKAGDVSHRVGCGEPRDRAAHRQAPYWWAGNDGFAGAIGSPYHSSDRRCGYCGWPA